jgi:hypothetical protein
MKILNILLLVLTAVVGVQNNFAQEAALMKGTDKPLYSNKEIECYVFEKFVVTNKNSMSDTYNTNDNIYKDGEISQRIDAFKRVSGVTPKESCQKKDDSIFVYEAKEEVYFVGIYARNNYVFVDLESSPDTQKMLIFNALTGKQVFKMEHTEWDKPKRLANNIFYFENWTKDGPAKRCPQGKKWEKQGLGVSWIQPYKLNLKTMQKTTNGVSYCVSVN